MSLGAGSKVGRYVVKTLLGAGGMGEVYAALDPGLGRMVAVKVLPRGVVDQAWVARFEREARAVGALSHPNILAVHDIGTEAGVPYLVTELLVGETVQARIARGPLPAATALDFGQQIARGLAAAHARGVIHRDLKPSNLFITRDGVVKILDFGIAKVTSPGGPASGHASTLWEEGTQLEELTATGAVIGTVGYMSPEQVRGHPADARSDIFSLGTVIYELVTARRPFQRDTLPETAVAILREEPPPMSTTTTPVPPVLERLVRRCLQKGPEDRFQNAGDLGFALESLTLAGGSETAPEPPRPVPRRRAAYVAAGAVAAALAAVGGFLILGRTPADPPAIPGPAPAPPPPPPPSPPPEVPAGAAIDAGCTFSGQQLRGEIGSLHRVICPPNCLSQSGLLLGIDTYVLSSSVCIAGIHAGAIPPSGGTLTVRIDPGRPAYRGKTRNGVRSDDYGRASRSFSVILPSGPPASPPPGLVEAGCTFTGRQLESEVGSVHQVSCPAHCLAEFRLVLGTDVYVASSSICAAAIHAGVIRAGGGRVAVHIEPGRPQYEGSYRNGVTSDDYGSDNLSFSLSPPSD